MGSYNEDLFKKSFDFIKDIQVKERKSLEAAIDKEKNPYRKDSLKLMSQRLVLIIPFLHILIHALR